MQDAKEYILPFVQATMECFDTMMGVMPEKKEITLEAPPLQQSDVCAIIGLSGGAQGLVSITFSTNVALKLIERFVGEKFTEVNEDVTDAVGEIVNIIAGNAKAQMSHLNLMISLPSVMYGEKLSMSMPKDVPALSVRFDLPEIGETTLVVSLKVA